MEDYISEFLDVTDEDSSITDLKVEGNVKYVTVTKNLRHDLYCPLCGSKLHSNGRFTRHPKHQILQDGFVLYLTCVGRQWKCSNPECNYSHYDQFSFLEPSKQITKIIQIQIIMDLKDIKLSCKQVAEKYKVSDTYVHQLFMRYVNLPRLPLTEYLCIDEVYLNISPKCKYALVLMDFLTGEILDVVESRRKEVTDPYFRSIPVEERKKVKYLICDMYNPYINFTRTFFDRSVAVTDSFHVLQWLLKLIRTYINSVKRRYQDRDRKRLEERNEKTNRNDQTTQDSDEVYILKKAMWVMLSNRSNWTYREGKYNWKLGRVMDTYDWENAFLDLDNNFRAIRSLKDLYEEFNENFANDLEGAAKRLDELIKIYENSDIKIFKEFAQLLIEHRSTIINSFNYVLSEKLSGNETVLRRLSNGPMESFNNIPSALRSQSHGVNNFDYTRNRILWSVRKNASINLVPRSAKEVHTSGKKRKPYKKHNS